MNHFDVDIITIRDLVPSDLPQVLEIERACFPDPWTLESFRNSLNSRYFKSLGAFNPQLLGYIISMFAAGELHILNIAVKPRFRRQGLAGKLLDELFNHFNDQLTFAYLEVRVSNLSAINFYHRRGFRQVGLRKKYYPNGEDAILMTKQMQ